MSLHRQKERGHACVQGKSANEYVDVTFKHKSTCTVNIHFCTTQQQPHQLSALHYSKASGKHENEMCHIAVPAQDFQIETTSLNAFHHFLLWKNSDVNQVPLG